MMKFLLSTLAYVMANGVGLLIAVLLLPGFQIDALSVLIAVLLFSGVQAVAGPLLTRFAPGAPAQLQGGIALIAAALGLLVTVLAMSAMQVGGISNFLAATLLVWLGSLITAILLPIYVFKSLRAPKA